MRAFVAIELPDTVREDLASLGAGLRSSAARASWVRAGNMHLTLRFLGEIDESQAGKLKTGLRRECRDLAPLRLCLKGLGFFPSPRRPSVFWAGVESLGGDLHEVQRQAEACARAAGLPPERKAFHPHVTLARLRDARRLGTLVDDVRKMGSPVFGDEFVAAGVSLFRSELKPGGAVYQRMEAFPFRCQTPFP